MNNVLSRGLHLIALEFSAFVVCVCGPCTRVSEYKVSTLSSGTKVGTGSLCAYNFCKVRAVHCFVLGAKLMFQNGV